MRPVKWYLGLTKDFRSWVAFGTNLDPRIHRLYADEFVWFMGPYESKHEALIEKKAGGLQNPYPHEHSARIYAPGMFKRFRRQNNKFGPGVHVIWGIRKKGSQHPMIQALRFDSSKFTSTEARDWLRMHGARSGDILKFEPARR